MDTQMNAIVARGGSAARDDNAFSLRKQPIPSPGSRDLLVRLEAVGMNPVDAKMRKRMEGDKVLGWDACGIIEKTGDEVRNFRAGDAVFYAGDITRPGCNSEYHLVDERIVGPAPSSLAAEDAAAMPLTSITAWESLFDRLGFVAEKQANTGRSVLIIGGAGGVGSIAVQLARWAGLTVYATASRPETTEWCRSLGADLILDHRHRLADELQRHGVSPVEAIFCTTNMEAHWQEMADCVRPQGRIALIDDPVAPPDIRLFKQKSVHIAWEFMYTRSMFQTEDMDEQGRLLTLVARLLDAGELRPTRRKTRRGLTVDTIRAMHLEQESGTMIGKQVLLL